MSTFAAERTAPRVVAAEARPVRASAANVTTSASRTTLPISLGPFIWLPRYRCGGVVDRRDNGSGDALELDGRAPCDDADGVDRGRLEHEEARLVFGDE